jgi:hypothetical protein
MEDGSRLVVLNLDILLAITFLMVLIHFAFTPMLDPIRRPLKNLAKALPMIDFLLVCKVQLSTLMLFVTHNTTGCGLSVIFRVSKMRREAQ